MANLFNSRGPRGQARGEEEDEINGDEGIKLYNAKTPGIGCPEFSVSCEPLKRISQLEGFFSGGMALGRALGAAARGNHDAAVMPVKAALGDALIDLDRAVEALFLGDSAAHDKHAFDDM